jgi:hypothetical protein
MQEQQLAPPPATDEVEAWLSLMLEQPPPGEARDEAVAPTDDRAPVKAEAEPKPLSLEEKFAAVLGRFRGDMDEALAFVTTEAGCTSAQEALRGPKDKIEQALKAMTYDKAAFTALKDAQAQTATTLGLVRKEAANKTKWAARYADLRADIDFALEPPDQPGDGARAKAQQDLKGADTECASKIAAATAAGAEALVEEVIRCLAPAKEGRDREVGAACDAALARLERVVKPIAEQVSDFRQTSTSDGKAAGTLRDKFDDLKRSLEAAEPREKRRLIREFEQDWTGSVNDLGVKAATRTFGKIAAEVQELLKLDATKAGAALQQAKATLKQANDEYNAKIGAADAAGAANLVGDVSEALKAMKKASAGRILIAPEAAAGGGRDRELLAKAIAYRKEDPGVLEALMAEPNGPTLLDRVVAAMGEKADSPEKRQFLKAAIKARFKLAFVRGGAEGTGDDETHLTKSALPRLYRLMRLVPESHTTGNESLQGVVRDRTPERVGGDYSPMTKVATISVGRTTGLSVKKREYKGTKVKYFDAATIHEIGHSVDDKVGFMDKRCKGGTAFGGWKNETAESVAEEAGNSAELKCFTELGKSYPRPFLRAYLVTVLTGGDPKGSANREEVRRGTAAAMLTPEALVNDPAVKKAAEYVAANGGNPVTTRVIDSIAGAIGYTKLPKAAEPVVREVIEKVLAGARPGDAAEEVLAKYDEWKTMPETPDWNRLAKHPAVTWCEAVRLKGKAGLWAQGKGGATKRALGGRVYQESYAGKWVSYALSARGSEICDYQFRAPGEWFAEAYTAYYLKAIKATGPYAWLAAVHNDQADTVPTE